MFGFGVVCFVYADFLRSLQPVPHLGAFHAPLAMVNGLALAAAGVCLAIRWHVRTAGYFVAGFLLTWIVLLHVPSAFVNPELLRSPWWIRTFETLALAGIALVVATHADRRVPDNLRRVGRIAFGISLPVFGVLHFVYAENVASLIPAWYPAPLFLAYLTGVGHIAAGLAIASGVLARTAAICAGSMYAIWALTLHLPRVLHAPEVTAGLRAELTSFFICIAFWGGAWILAATAHPADPSNRVADGDGNW